jgi:hypothetical protein
VIDFRRLTPGDVEQDYAAVMREIPMLRRWSAQDWPTTTFSPADDLVDLERHDREHEDGTAFTYSVLLDGLIVGCIYVHPIGEALRSRQVQPPADVHALAHTVVRGWAHDVPVEELVTASLEAHGGDFGPALRRWWQTNTACPEQLAACERLGLTDELRFRGPTATWVLRAVPE